MTTDLDRALTADSLIAAIRSGLCRSDAAASVGISDSAARRMLRAYVGPTRRHSAVRL